MKYEKRKESNNYDAWITTDFRLIKYRINYKTFK